MSELLAVIAVIALWVVPRAEVYRYEADGQWALLDSLAHRPDWARDDCRLTAMASREGRVLDLSNSEPLLIGFGAQTYFSGAIADLRLYARALNAEDVAQIHTNRTVQ